MSAIVIILFVLYGLLTLFMIAAFIWAAIRDGKRNDDA